MCIETMHQRNTLFINGLIVQMRVERSSKMTKETVAINEWKTNWMADILANWKLFENSKKKYIHKQLYSYYNLKIKNVSHL